MREYARMRLGSRGGLKGSRRKIDLASSCEAGGTLWGGWQADPAGPSPALGAGSAPGLSLVHICTEGDFKLTIARGGHGGALVQIGAPRSRPECGKRGRCGGFNAACARRLKRKLDSVDRSKVTQGWFVTLTCKAGECSWLDFERVRRRYMMRVKRRWGVSCVVIWKKEPHKSGWPHLHCLVLWLLPPPSVVDFRSWNDVAWDQAVGDPLESGKRRFCRVEVMRSWNGVCWYAAKYLQKVEKTGEGRMWGIENRAVFPCSLSNEVLPRSVGVRMRRVLRRLQERKRARWLIRSTDEQSGKRAWVRLRPFPGSDSVDDTVRLCGVLGITVRLARANVLRRRTVKVWLESEEWKSGMRRSRRFVERGDDELESFVSSWHSVPSGELERLRDFLVDDFRRGGGTMSGEVGVVRDYAAEPTS